MNIVVQIDPSKLRKLISWIYCGWVRMRGVVCGPVLVYKGRQYCAQCAKSGHLSIVTNVSDNPNSAMIGGLSQDEQGLPSFWHFCKRCTNYFEGE